MLIFGNGKANAKLAPLAKSTGLRLATFSLPAGRTCPGAESCKAHVRTDKAGKRTLIDGPKAEFRCFAASQEAQYLNTFSARAANLDALKKARTVDRIADLIVDSFPKNVDAVRWHVSGDFYSRAYMAGVFEAFRRMPDRRAWLYTKSPHWLVELADRKPENISVTASIGGKYDRAAHENGIRTVSVVGAENQTTLPIDHDDSHALAPNVGPLGGEHFALVIHGTQQPDTWGSRQLVQLRKSGAKSGYTRARA